MKKSPKYHIIGRFVGKWRGKIHKNERVRLNQCRDLETVDNDNQKDRI